MIKTVTFASVIVLALTTASSLPAAIITYNTVLSGANEVPPTGSPATGTSTVTLDTTTNLLTVNEVFSGLTGPATGAHIHCCGPIGMNEPIALPFPTFPATTFGTFTQSYDLTLAATYTPAFITATGGTVAGAQAALIAGLNGGQAYANIHTLMFPGGEIRGQLAAVPEPATSALVGASLLLLALRRR